MSNSSRVNFRFISLNKPPNMSEEIFSSPTAELPHDPVLINEIHTLYNEVRDIFECRDAFQAAHARAAVLRAELKRNEMTKQEERLRSIREEIRELGVLHAEILLSMSKAIEPQEQSKGILDSFANMIINTNEKLTNTGNDNFREESITRMVKEMIKQGDLSNKYTKNERMVISKETEMLIENVKNQPYYKLMIQIIKKEVKQLLAGLVYREVEVVLANTKILLIYVPKLTNSSNITTLSEQFPNICEILIHVVKDNLKERLLKVNNFSEAFVLVNENTNLTKNASLYLKNIPEWILDVVMKRVVSLGSNIRSLDDTEQVDGLYVSKGSLILEHALLILKDLESTRKTKAELLLKKTISKFLAVPSYLICSEDDANQTCRLPSDEIQLFYLYFSDISRFISKKNYEDLNDERETLFHHCIRSSAMIDEFAINQMKRSLLEAKAILQELHYDFVENTRKYVSSSMRQLMTIQFFEEFYRNFITKCLTVEWNDGILSELMKFVLDFSFGCDRDSITSYQDLKEHLDMRYDS